MPKCIDEVPIKTVSGMKSSKQARRNSVLTGKSNDLYKEYFERSADAILIIRDNTFVDCNQAVLDMLRYETREEMLQTHPSELSPEYQPDGSLSYEKANRMMEIALKDGSHRFEWDHKRADGEVFPVEVLLTSIPGKDGSILQAVWRDITERKQMQSEINHAQKMETVGRLVGGIAHDFNNLLVAILGNTELLQMELEQGEIASFGGYLDEIYKAGNRAACLVSQLLAYSRKQVLRARVIDLAEISNNINPMLKHIIGEDIEVRMFCSPQPMPVLADPGQLEQVLMNLITNARDAMPHGGRICIETFKAELDTWQSHRGMKFPAGTYAGMRVSDSGSGIDTAVIEQIFEPFFTTKSTGTGLGLSTACGIVNQSGGGIQLKTGPAEGTSFTILLPICDRAPDTEDVKAPEPVAFETRARTVLLVEDDTSVSRLAERVLRRNGYKVLTAANGVEAMELFDDGEIAIDLLLTDVIMPRMGGPELARRLAVRVKDLKVLYISGYTNEALTTRGVLEADINLVQKPFTVHQLASMVGQVMSE